MLILYVFAAFLAAAALGWASYKMATEGLVSALLIWWPLARLTGQALGLLIVAAMDVNK